MLCPESTGSSVLSPDPGILASFHSDEASILGIHPDPAAARDPGIAVSLQEHPRLLALLNSEPFRAELRARPVEALARQGIHLDPRAVPTRVTLPEIKQECVVRPPLWGALLV